MYKFEKTEKCDDKDAFIWYNIDDINISRSTFYKIKNGENVTTDVLLRMCNCLDCDVS
ncbi:MAG: helix-turn-helix transcriptional regulator [[Eubacterium] sulci]|nr:helix-turn-helix transcriptional regulator [[Eubacterium] sulci]MBF1153861.1 helix-turn-helix transcriptional regulator [[Eubacterium] sulci]MBF1161069.1 helix-turn-helix transcriptional regulator [[Eubacterium] sulci]MBF1187729.1 helix-turn-helix transcriptional regulator [[Eubacterium] sulci]